MGRRKSDIGQQKRRNALAKQASSRAINGEELARSLVRRGLASPCIESPRRMARPDSHIDGDQND